MNAAVLILIIVVVVLLIAVGALGTMMSRRKRSERLQENFGPEYERKVSETGDRKAAEAELEQRQQRHDKLQIRELAPEERARLQGSWESIQRGFVDDPTRALQDADLLVVEIMHVRGYPVDDFDQRADDISVEHPAVVHHYREARSVRDASTGGPVDTERQRRAVTSYRSLVEALLGHTGRDTDYPGGDARPTEERTR